MNTDINTDNNTKTLIALGSIALGGIALLASATHVVPTKSKVIVERLGKYHKTMNAGINFKIPIVDKASYHVSMKEDTINIDPMHSITKDNVGLKINSVVYMKIFDPVKSVYEIESLHNAIEQLCQSSIRNEIGTLPLDVVFSDRDRLNSIITQTVNESVQKWGANINLVRIKDMTMPPSIDTAMQKQMIAERTKRAMILESEGNKQSQINNASATAESMLMVAGAEAKSALIKYEANSTGIKLLADSMTSTNNEYAMRLVLGEKYIEAFSHLAKTTNTMIVSSDPSDITSMIAKATTIASINKV